MLERSGVINARDILRVPGLNAWLCPSVNLRNVKQLVEAETIAMIVDIFSPRKNSS